MVAARSVTTYFYGLLPFAVQYWGATNLSGREHFIPLWPLFWSDVFSFGFADTVNLVHFFTLFMTIAGVLAYRYRFARLLVFIGVWQTHALLSSFGAHNHQWYLWVYTSFVFIFLPDIWSVTGNNPENRRKFLLIVWLAQALVAISYTMAGYHKFATAISQYWQGEIGAFSVNGFSYLIASWTAKLQQEALFAPFIIEHPWTGWVAFNILILVQIFSLWVMVRPRLQRVWVCTLIVFHFGTYYTMGIEFHPLIILDMALFLNSPFVKARYTLREFFSDLPMIGILKRAKKRNMAHPVSAA